MKTKLQIGLQNYHVSRVVSFGFHCTLIQVKCTYFKKNWKTQLLYTPGIITCFEIHVKTTINTKLRRKPRNVCIHKSTQVHWHISVTGRLNNVGGGGGAIELHELNYVARTLSQWNTLELGGPVDKQMFCAQNLLQSTCNVLWHIFYIIKVKLSVIPCGVNYYNLVLHLESIGYSDNPLKPIELVGNDDWLTAIRRVPRLLCILTSMPQRWPCCNTSW